MKSNLEVEIFYAEDELEVGFVVRSLDGKPVLPQHCIDAISDAILFDFGYSYKHVSKLDG